MTDEKQNPKAGNATETGGSKGFPQPRLSQTSGNEPPPATPRPSPSGGTSSPAPSHVPPGEAKASSLQVGIASGAAGLVVGLVIGVLIGHTTPERGPAAQPEPSAQTKPSAAPGSSEPSSPPAASEAPSRPPPPSRSIAVDVGAPGASEHLNEGFHDHEPVGVRSVAAMQAPEASVTVPLDREHSGAELIVVGRAAGGEPLDLEVSLGEKRLANWSAPAQWQLFTATLPDEAVSGEGTIVFRSAALKGGGGSETAGPVWLVDWIGIRKLTSSTALDLSSAEGRARLLHGFHLVEGLETETPSVWSDGKQSRIGLVLEPRRVPYQLELTGHAFHPIAPFSLTVRINGESVGEIEVSGKQRQYSIAVPAERLSRGTNTVELAYPTTAKPVDTIEGSNDQRELAFNLFALELAPAGP